MTLTCDKTMKLWRHPFYGGGWKEGRLIFLISGFTFAVFLGFILELLTVERLNLLLRFPLYNYGTQTQNISWVHILPPVEKISYPPYSKTSLEVGTNHSLWEKPTLLNISHFRWIRNNESTCQVDKAHPDAQILAILVHTARPHFMERLNIRKTWGSLIFYKKWSIRFVFLIGEADREKDPYKNTTIYETEEASLEIEHSVFGDIVQGNFIDTYKNLTYKHMMGYKWILNFCTNAKFILKVDDDMFVDVMRFLDWRSEDVKSATDKKVPDLYCSTLVGAKPQRCIGCKWYTSEEDWPMEFFPDYCSGCSYGITLDLIRQLFSVVSRVPFFWIDDVFVTGMLMEQLKKENPGYEPVYKHLWGQVKALAFRTFRPMCERHDMEMKRRFGAIVPIPRGNNFERDMICLWNKTLHDDVEQRRRKESNEYEDEYAEDSDEEK